ncbi:hypothetical protein [Glycomyces arizonensis]|uniref:hypothetical protein n=1 Tax=Glycomyces arizonensis TaxID=256035 RepID=UPI0004047E1C|nr:hypothetical protein [Glycomyces arizonensis]
MSYWDDEMTAEVSRLEALPSRLRLKVATKVLAWTVRTLDPPIGHPAASSFVGDGLERAESAVARGQGVVDGVDEMMPRFNALFEDMAEPRGAQFLSAVLLLFAQFGSELPARVVVNLLSDSYEGALYRATSAAITIEIERSTPRAIEVIEYQKDAIEAAVREAQG